jgi:hypothetical protein
MFVAVAPCPTFMCSPVRQRLGNRLSPLFQQGAHIGWDASVTARASASVCRCGAGKRLLHFEREAEVARGRGTTEAVGQPDRELGGGNLPRPLEAKIAIELAPWIIEGFLLPVRSRLA